MISGQSLGDYVLLPNVAISGSSTNGEVSSAQHNPSAAEFGCADHVIGRSEAFQ
jgi:hypothetical protein